MHVHSFKCLTVTTAEALFVSAVVLPIRPSGLSLLYLVLLDLHLLTGRIADKNVHRLCCLCMRGMLNAEARLSLAFCVVARVCMCNQQTIFALLQAVDDTAAYAACAHHTCMLCLLFA